MLSAASFLFAFVTFRVVPAFLQLDDLALVVVA